MNTMTKYSQGEEQGAILDALKNIERGGRFLDIGAYNPTVFSNTRALWETGWSGVMVEPSPEPFLSLLKEYGADERVDLICAAVGFEKGLTKIHATADATSTTDQGHFEKWKAFSKYIGSFHIPVITIADILNQFGAFQFVNIDTENTSVDVLHVILQTAMFPQCICVEWAGTGTPSIPQNRYVEALDAAQAKGYKYKFHNTENLIVALG